MDQFHQRDAEEDIQDGEYVPMMLFFKCIEYFCIFIFKISIGST